MAQTSQIRQITNSNALTPAPVHIQTLYAQGDRKLSPAGGKSKLWISTLGQKRQSFKFKWCNKIFACCSLQLMTINQIEQKQGYLSKQTKKSILLQQRVQQGKGVSCPLDLVWPRGQTSIAKWSARWRIRFSIDVNWGRTSSLSWEKGLEWCGLWSWTFQSRFWNTQFCFSVLSIAC